MKYGCGSLRKYKKSSSGVNTSSGHCLLDFICHEEDSLSYLSRHTPENLKSLDVLLSEGEIRTVMH